MADSPTPLQRTLMKRAAALFFLGILTGAWAGHVLTHGKAIFFLPPVEMKNERLALSAHLNALLGCFWLLAIAFTVEHTRYGERGKLWLARLATLVTYANWSVTVLASILDRRGLAFSPDDPKENLIAALLMGTVVLPSIFTSGMWAWGLMGEREARSSGP